MFERLTLWQTMKERRVDVTMDVKPSTIAYLRQQAKEIYVIAGWRNHMPFFVMGPPETSSLKEIAGKRIGVIDLDDILVTMLSYWLVQEGMDPATDVEWVTGHRHPQWAGAQQDNRVDVAFCDKVDIDLLRSEGHSVLLDVMTKYPNGRPHRVIAATGRAIEERPEQIMSFVKAMISAYWFVRTKDNFAVTQAMERRLRRDSPDEDERARIAQFGSEAQAEMMPFPIDGLPTGLDQYLARGRGTPGHRRPDRRLGDVETRLCPGGLRRTSTRPDLKANLQTIRDVVARIGY